MLVPVNLIGQQSSKSTPKNPTHIRWLLNNAAVPVSGIKGCTPNADGLCAFSTFVEGMKQCLREVDFQVGCFANYMVPNPDNIADGQLQMHLKHQS
ncbi:hypothetical protein C8J57DRAFT_1495124 [Mycena rebaudengoi]|nr:hypothetical protein C8J57DRAFT_1495124 [Mycena rebaudengoi]